LKKKKQPSAVKPTCSVVRTNFQIQTRQFDYIFGLLQLIRPNFIPTKKKKKKKKNQGRGAPNTAAGTDDAASSRAHHHAADHAAFCDICREYPAVAAQALPVQLRVD
jgi:hypothetical protein